MTVQPDDLIPALLIPVSEVTLWQAALVHPEVRAEYEATMPGVLTAYASVSTESFWHLTVGEHTALTEHINLPVQASQALARIRAELEAQDE